jgi:hypothetical protein
MSARTEKLDRTLARLSAQSAIGGTASHPNTWAVIFADVFDSDGIKIGHCATSGYHDHAWTFYPRDESRRKSDGFGKDPVCCLPVWAKRAGAHCVIDGSYNS